MSEYLCTRLEPSCLTVETVVSEAENYLIDCWRGWHGKEMQDKAFSCLERIGHDVTALRRQWQIA